MRNSKPSRVAIAAILLMCCAASLSVAAPQADEAGARLRAALRSATVQLRDLQDQNAVLLAKQAEGERLRLALAEKVAAGEKERDALRQQVKTGQAASAQVAEQLQAQKQNLAIGEVAYRDNLAKWESAYKDAAESARMRDADAKRLDGLLVQARGRIQACEAKNSELYKLGKEVLDLYEQKGLFSVLAANEPVTKLKRVQLDGVIQDYEDKLRASEIARPVQ
jgi:septal ring factor EnvC (AmiA/AmiB activator)